MSLFLNLRLRRDLVIQPHDAMCGTWVVKDPIALRFYLFGADEHFILQRLDGATSADEIIDDFARERAPKQMTTARLHAFLSTLCRNGLACSDAASQGARLLKRDADQSWRESAMRWTNPLAIRFPGIDPDAILDRLYPVMAWCFSRWFLVCCALSWLAAAGIALSHGDALRAPWPRADELIDAKNLVWLAVALAMTKVLHELAHAMTCKHFGGRCHELGVMLLVFTPCLFCNVTDAWMMRNRWQRIAISAAGILMELQLASLATIVWRFTHPGLLHVICLHVLFVCSVGTLLFNGNPLLKYDGYFVLSDLVRAPNLWQKSRSDLADRIRARLLHPVKNGGCEPQGRRSLLFPLYAFASIAYRVCLTLAILLLVYRALHPLGFDWVVWLVAASIVGQAAIAWGGPAAHAVRDPTLRRRLRKLPAAILLSCGLAALAAILGVSFTCEVKAPAVLQPRDAQRVYVATPGIVLQSVQAGDHVRAGETLAILENDELRNELQRIQSDLSRAESRIQTLKARQGDESAAAAQLPVAREFAADLAQQSRLRSEQLRSLTLRAPIEGTVLSPPSASPDRQAHELTIGTGTPLEPENCGCFVERGTLFCLVGDSRNCDAVVLVDETDLPYVREGQPARLRLEHAIGEVITGRVVEIAELNAENTPPELAWLRDVPVRRDEADGLAPIRTLYQVRLELDASRTPRLIGARGIAKITVDPQTVAERLRRYFLRNFAISPASGSGRPMAR